MKRTAALLFVFALVSSVLVSIAAQQSPRAADPRFTEQDFARLRWIEGSWIGSGYKEPFYERYRFTSSTTIEVEHFADAAFLKSTGEKGAIYLADGQILSGSGDPKWKASRLTGDRIEFVSMKDAANGFSWTRKSPDAWTAVLNRPGGAKTVYEMTRAKR